MFNKLDKFGNFVLKIFIFTGRMLLLNVMFILYTLIGGIILGIFPSLGALFATMRKIVDKTSNLSTWRYFNKYYFSNFWRLNGLGYIYIIPIGVLIPILLLTVNSPSIVVNAIYIITLLILSFYLLSFPHFFTLYVHFDMPFKEYLYKPYFLTLLSVKQNIFLVIGYVTSALFFYYFPVFLYFIAWTVPVYWTMLILYRHYITLESNVR